MKMHQRRAANLRELAAQLPAHKKHLNESANLLEEMSRDNSRLRSILLSHGLIAGPMNDRKRNLLWTKLLTITTEVTGVSKDDLMGRSQVHKIGTPRRIMITAWHEVTTDSYAGIGRRFGKDHSAIIHSVKTTTQECQIYPHVREMKEKIADALRVYLERYQHTKPRPSDEK